MVTTEANFVKSTNARIAKAINGTTNNASQNLESTLTQINEVLLSLDERVTSLEVKVNSPSLEPVLDNQTY